MMFEMPMDIAITVVILRFIPEIVWLERLYEKFLECFDHSSRRPTLKPAPRDMGYLSPKALLHIGIQRKCIVNESEKAMFKSISSRNLIVGSDHFKDDSDLKFTLSIIDRISGDSQVSMDWKGFPFTTPHHA